MRIRDFEDWNTRRMELRLCTVAERLIWVEARFGC
jgi:hypothetical protein